MEAVQKGQHSVEKIALKTIIESMTEARTYGFDASADMFCNLPIDISLIHVSILDVTELCQPDKCQLTRPGGAEATESQVYL